MMYTDPTREFFWAALPLVVKTAIGVYTRYKIADDKRYDLGDWQTYGYMLSGAVVSRFSEYLGGTIAAGGGIIANTGNIMMSSYTNSMGMTMLLWEQG